MEISPDGSPAYYEYLRLKDERELADRVREREHLERLKALEADEDAESHRAHAERMKALEMGLDPSKVGEVSTERELEDQRRRWGMKHAERMKALEMGLDIRSRWPLAFACTAIGFGVPAVAFLALLGASHSPFFNQWHWNNATAVSLPAVVLASIVAWRGLASPAGPRQPDGLRVTRDAKPEPDPSAFELAGHRG